MNVNSFHVRDPLPPGQTARGEIRARSLESRIAQWMAQNDGKWFTEYDFDDNRTLATSIRRALCNLKKKGLIVACHPSEKPVGRHGVSIFKYKYNPHQPKQEELWPKKN